jgi:putative NADH-flavin reductase
MKLTIFGASGAIGRILADLALAASHEVRAYVRRSDAFPSPIPGLTVLVGSLDNLEAIEEAVGGADAVISALGPALDTSRKPQGLHISEGHRTIVKAMKNRGVSRLVTLATPSLRSDEDPRTPVTVLPGLMARLFFPGPYRDIVALGPVLRESELNWTVVRIVNPNARHVSDDYGVWLGEGPVRMSVSRRNVAAFMLKVTEEGLHIGKMPVVFNR